MTALECLKILRKGFIILLIWNILLTVVLCMQFCNKQEEKLRQEICNLEAIPQNELVEVE